MKRVLIITRNFPPLWGGMERLNLHLVDELSRYFEISLVAPEGAIKHTSSSVSVTQVPLRPLLRFLLSATYQAIHLARTWRPDIVVAGSGLTAPLALLAAKCCGAKSIVYVHGLDLTVPDPVYRTIWLAALRQVDGVIANSGATETLARDAGIAPQRIGIVHPGVTVPENIDPEVARHFRIKYELGAGPILLSVGRLAARKGLREFVADVFPHIVEQYPDVLLVVIGSPPSDALFAEVQSPASIQIVAGSKGIGRNILFLGGLDNISLSHAYVAASVHVFPVRDIPNNPEGFGMVAIEAAAYGLPTVAYAVGGVVDAVAEGQSGRLIEPGNARAFADAVINQLREPADKKKLRAFAQEFAWERFGAKLYKQLTKYLS